MTFKHHYSSCSQIKQDQNPLIFKGTLFSTVPQMHFEKQQKKLPLTSATSPSARCIFFHPLPFSDFHDEEGRIQERGDNCNCTHKQQGTQRRRKKVVHRQTRQESEPHTLDFGSKAMHRWGGDLSNLHVRGSWRGFRVRAGFAAWEFEGLLFFCFKRCFEFSPLLFNLESHVQTAFLAKCSIRRCTEYEPPNREKRERDLEGASAGGKERDKLVREWTRSNEVNFLILAKNAFLLQCKRWRRWWEREQNPRTKDLFVEDWTSSAPPGDGRGPGRVENPALKECSHRLRCIRPRSASDALFFDCILSG